MPESSNRGYDDRQFHRNMQGLSSTFIGLQNEPWADHVAYWAKRHMKIKFDRISVFLIIVLIATLIAFFTGMFPYPYGWIVITVLLVIRLIASQAKE
jgi:hypothetical protein